MNQENFNAILRIIGYEPENGETFFGLLQQAFTRRSYSKENGGQDNENLEFVGDRALDFAVTKKLTEYYNGHINADGEFEMKNGVTEGTLTDTKKKLVERPMLAHRIGVMGLQNYLIMGKGDVAQNVQDEDSVKEDLFEAIIGAVTIDCNWNLERIQNVVETMLDIEYYLENGFDDENNYVDLIIQWSQKKYGISPMFMYDEGKCSNEFTCKIFFVEGFLNNPLTNDAQKRNELPSEEFVRQCLNGHFFRGEGHSKSKARMNAAIKAYEYLEENGLLLTIEDIIGEPCEERAINQLQELAQKGYCEMPEYVFEESHDENGNPIWHCECHVEGQKYYHQYDSSSKKQAKRKVAYDMLIDIVNRSDI